MTMQTIACPMRPARQLAEVVGRVAEFVLCASFRAATRLQERARIRKELEAWRYLDDHLLRDLGLSRSDVVCLTDRRGAQSNGDHGPKGPRPAVSTV